MSAEQQIAIVGGMLIDGHGKDPVRDSVVLIEGKTIQTVGRKGRLTVPKGAKVIDAAGKTVMPGLFDCHTHVWCVTANIERNLFTPRSLAVFQTAAMMKRMLHAGFTTIRDAGGLGDVGFRVAAERGLIEGPRVLASCIIGQTGGHGDGYYPSGVYITDTPGTIIADGVPEVQRAARTILRQGFDFVKVCTSGGIASPSDLPEYTEWTMDELRAIVYEAEARGKKVMAHAEGNQGIKNAILAGVWSVEHCSMLDEEAIALALKHGTYLVPTLYILEDLVTRGKEIGLSDVSLAKVARVHRTHAESFRQAAAAGAKIACGTDIIDEGSHGKNARELEYMVLGGYTPMQAIMAATRVSADCCRIGDKVGTLEAGKLADVLVVDGDPLDDIKVLQDQAGLLLVMKEGIAYVNRME